MKLPALLCLLLLTLSLPLTAEEVQPRVLTIEAEGGAKVRFAAPDRYKVYSAKDEPMDWDYALVDEAANFDFGIRTEPTKGKGIEDLQAAFLAGVHSMHDPKVTSVKDIEFTLADGSKVHGYLYQSEYWKARQVVIIPGKKRDTIIEFRADTLEALKAQEEQMKVIVATVGEVLD